ncbi:non-specific lipid transfer protein GPI-anchored 14 isoform X2 [Cryptomeria japonica]|uniref:non-specific lipid transfer protein GPI-anchored 14 isoform X2 n=1 Tax=Cryptomeria japonica TaxID=3369 RepID=UPI0025AC41E8|nr:non-specific lipid transfer protein GPI-anchored 14 isoform X2 [Cryptomeria japonica]
MADRRLIFVVVFFSLLSGTFSDFAADQKECGSQLVTLSSCIQYVQGSNKIPTKDCCDGLLQIHKSNPKCLCVLIKDSSNPQLGISINLTLALELPMICKVQTNISTCPALLHMSPSSPEAQVFNSTATSSPAARNTSTSSNSSSTSSSESSSSANTFNVLAWTCCGLALFHLFSLQGCNVFALILGIQN